MVRHIYIVRKCVKITESKILGTWISDEKSRSYLLTAVTLMKRPQKLFVASNPCDESLLWNSWTPWEILKPWTL